MNDKSDPTIDDISRTGDDLIARIRELTDKEMTDKNGWRPLLWACKREIMRLQNKISWLDKFKCWVRALLDKDITVAHFREVTDILIGGKK